ncbi:hypothetical protein K402DRAFT_421391 [Aulographum hederae CBS 113979]|uniref:Uncharacterized protein n=1 Tax=Aulographum hederae CBS 113979 TaxID=1176131 RepID=A0A6G1GYY2_9PEZI|nr:hypothetical protein K402DRAFT_421391 [Aulographum hederae CBS 113979]
MIRPRTLIRIVLYGTITWLCLVGLWLGLPSPSPYDDGTTYATSTLLAGRTLTRVYSTSDHNVQTSEYARRKSFALTYRLSPSHTSVLVNGHYIFPIYNNWTDTPAVAVQVATGDQDGINPPWFNVADSTLLFHKIHYDDGAITLRARRIGDTWEIYPEGNGHQPLLSLTGIGNGETAAPMDINKATVPAPPESFSPSRTYYIRLVIFYLMVPIGMVFVVIGGTFGATFTILFKIFETLLLVGIQMLFAVAVVLVFVRVFKGKDAMEELIEETLAKLRSPIVWIAERFKRATRRRVACIQKQKWYDLDR